MMIQRFMDCGDILYKGILQKIVERFQFLFMWEIFNTLKTRMRFCSYLEYNSLNFYRS
jgi:hypothetical protein